MTEIIYESRKKRIKKYIVQMRSEGVNHWSFVQHYRFRWLAKFSAWFLSDAKYYTRVVLNRD